MVTVWVNIKIFWKQPSPPLNVDSVLFQEISVENVFEMGKRQKDVMGFHPPYHNKCTEVDQIKRTYFILVTKTKTKK